MILHLACSQCCRRRITCDRTEPQCLKCQKKGLQCSGQGVRYLMSTHANRDMTHFRHNNVPCSISSLAINSTQGPKATKRHKGLKWIDTRDRFAKAPPARPKGGTLAITSSDSALKRDEQDALQWPVPSSSEQRLPLPPPDQVRVAVPKELSSASTHHHPMPVSQTVAPYFVTLDSFTNGYRDIILPLACQDQLVSRAVSVISAFHIVEQTPSIRPAVEVAHHSIIETLRHESQRRQPTNPFTPSTLATVLVLLAGETITGSNNFTYLLEMLTCIENSEGFITSLPPGTRAFFRQQVRLFQLFGYSFVDKQKAIRILAELPERYLEFTSYPDLPTNSAQSRNLDRIRDIIRFAAGIYLKRAQSCITLDESRRLVETLRLKALSLNPCAEGTHALVWPYFVAAAESDLPEDRLFFVERLSKIYQSTTCGNIPFAGAVLQRIWALQGVRDWTDVIVGETRVLIM
ncbi:hypothetical protein CC79DRAFT_1341829 [Sarocladium strictum]